MIRRLWDRLHRHFCFRCERPTIFRHDVCDAAFELELRKEWRRGR